MQHGGTLLDLTRRHNVGYLHLHKITVAKLATGCHGEQREIAAALCKFKSNPYRPIGFEFSGRF